MTAALAPAPSTTRVALRGRAESVAYAPGQTVEYYLKSLNAEVQPGDVVVVGAMPAALTDIVPEHSALTVAPRPGNG
jgi:hypothetical protein